MKRLSLERQKIDYCRYEYFIADENGNRIKEIDSKYYNCNEVAKDIHYACEEELDDYDNIIERNYETSFRFYEFSYNLITPVFYNAYRIKEDNWGEYRELIPDYEYYNEDDWDVELEEKGGTEIILKAIIDDSGKLIIDDVSEIVEFIDNLHVFIVKIQIYKNCRWINEVESSLGEDKYLWAVVNSNGEFLFKPYRSEIKYSAFEKCFIVAGIIYYDEKGLLIKDFK